MLLNPHQTDERRAVVGPLPSARMGVQPTTVRAALVLAVVAALALTAGPAQAREPSRKKAIWGPALVDGRSQFPIYEDLGVGLLQLAIPWNEVARSRPAAPRDPSDPAYVWPAEVDFAVREARRRGIEIVLLVAGTPAWANGGRDFRHAPSDPGDYADFLEAAERRWPSVDHWLIWGEPTKAANFQPLVPTSRTGVLRGAAAQGPRTYARLLDRAYGRLKRLSRQNLVIGGNAYTTGSVRPLPFLRSLKLPDGRSPRMDLFGHNPFSVRRPVLSQRPLGRGFADFGDLDTLAGWLDRYRVGRRRGLRIFVSEYSLPTDKPNREFNFYVTRRVQADWIATALRSVRRSRRIYTFGYLGLRDEPANATDDEVRRGLIDAQGRRKPAFASFARG